MAESNALCLKNENIRNIFNTMEYGNVTENVNAAKAWLEHKNKRTFFATGKEGKTSNCGSTEFTDINGNTITVWSVDEGEFSEIVSSMSSEWISFSGIQRALLLEKFAKELERNSTLICQLEVLLRGILNTDTKSKSLPLLIDYLKYYASWAVKYKRERQSWDSEGGITVSIIKDHTFLAMFGMVLGPALAAGYRIILQTSAQMSPIATLLLELAEASGIPKGTIKIIPSVLNINAIFDNADVGVVSYFGPSLDNFKENPRASTKNFISIINRNIPMIVFNNGDLDSACNSVVNAAWGCHGMLPWSVKILLVQEDILATFTEKLKHRLVKVRTGSALDKTADISYPLNVNISEKLVKIVEDAKTEGIEVYQRDSQNEDFRPTLLIGGRLYGNNVITDDEDIPAVTVLAFRTVGEAVNLANNSKNGFGASVWTESISLANEIVDKLNVSNIWINGHGYFSPNITIKPQKGSGSGCFGGFEGFYEYVKDNKLHKELTEKVPKVSKHTGESVGKDLENAIAVAKKRQQSWGKLPLSGRCEILKKLALDLHSKKQSFDEKDQRETEEWILNIYEESAELSNAGSVSSLKSHKILSFKEPVGVVTIDGDYGFSNVIVGSILLGNSVFILNTTPKYSRFLDEICKSSLMCGIPAGVFNVIFNCNSSSIDTFVKQKDLNVYFTLEFERYFNRIGIKDLKCICSKDAPRSQIIMNSTNVKNVWSNSGEYVI